MRAARWPRRRASPLRTPRRACTQRTQGAPRKQRTCLLLRRWVPAASLPRRGSSTGGDARLPRCACGVGVGYVRARGAAPRAARGNWGLVRLLLSLGAARLLPSSSRFRVLPGGGKTTNRPPKPPTGYPRHQLASPGTTTRPLSHLPVTQPPQGAWGRNHPNCVPMPSRLHTITSRHPLAPPARAARLRRPLAPPARAARSRRPLALPACVRHAVLLILRRFGDARGVGLLSM